VRGRPGTRAEVQRSRRLWLSDRCGWERPERWRPIVTVSIRTEAWGQAVSREEPLIGSGKCPGVEIIVLEVIVAFRVKPVITPVAPASRGFPASLT